MTSAAHGADCCVLRLISCAVAFGPSMVAAMLDASLKRGRFERKPPARVIDVEVLGSVLGMAPGSGQTWEEEHG
jgi:hypothetical protein